MLAWSGGSAEDLPADRLAGPRAVFPAQGFGGLRLVAVEPIELDGKRIGVAAAETLLAPAIRTTSAAPVWQLMTSFGPVAATPAALVGAEEDPRRPQSFAVAGSDGTPLLEVHFSVEATAGRTPGLPAPGRRDRGAAARLRGAALHRVAARAAIAIAAARAVSRVVGRNRRGDRAGGGRPARTRGARGGAARD